jgi:sigma-B regulation protein RsbU (phosphoserine phosphatase)
VTEAMNEQDDMFGEERLARLLEDDAGDSSDVLHERILRDVDAFVGTADQHDDMTMVLLRIDAVGPDGGRREPAGVTVDAGARA